MKLKLFHISQEFYVPLLVVIGTIVYGVLHFLQFTNAGIIVILAVILLGTYSLITETIASLLRRQFALDYIAILAIVVAVFTQQYLVGAILALMITTGRSLEAYGVASAKRSLTQLIDRIPTDVTLWENNQPGSREKITKIMVGTQIFIRKGQVVPLDGVLVSEFGEMDESSLTGEPYFVKKAKGDIIRSGTINIDQPIVISVSQIEANSTYKKIVNMVREAENEKSPLVRLADKYSTVFTLITFFLAGFAFIYSHFSLSSVLAVLAVATPCPLIIATPIALLGGVNAAAKKKIIVKKLAALEILARVNTVVFDKTGTITLGVPQLAHLFVENKAYTQTEVLSIAAAIERNSLHPLAKAIVAQAQSVNAKMLSATEVREVIGKGISAVVNTKTYLLTKIEGTMGMAIALMSDGKKIAIFQFADEVKPESKDTVQRLLRKGLSLRILTGDKLEAAQRIIAQLGENIFIHAECTPEDKQNDIKTLKKEGKITAMVGDGINDAPALALADVGLAFSNQEQTAASEAADIVLLGGNFTKVLDTLEIAQRTIRIARQSILWGIGLSIVAMLFASVGIIPPLAGAGLQECIDVAVIINSLRASK